MSRAARLGFASAIVPLVLAGWLIASASVAWGHKPTASGVQSRYNSTCPSASPWHWEPANRTIPIYLHTGLTVLKRPDGTNWTLAQIAVQLEQALATTNDLLGLSVRFYYAGTTSQLTLDQAIVVSANLSPSTVAYSATHVDDCASGHITRGHVELYAYLSINGANGGPRTFKPFDPAQATPGADIHVAFTHELGHTLALNHTFTDSYGGTPLALLEHSQGGTYVTTAPVMANTPPDHHRHWTSYERETLFAIPTIPYAVYSVYGIRTGAYKSWLSGSSGGYGSTWSVGDNDVPSGSAIAFRPGSLSKGAPDLIVPWIGVDNWRLMLKGMRKEFTGTETAFVVPPTDAYAPPAVAYDSVNQQFAIFYLEKDPPKVEANPPYTIFPYGMGSHGPTSPADYREKRLCWMTSPSGANWTSQGCLTNPNSRAAIRNRGDQVAASFDPYRKVFVVALVNGSYYINLLTIPVAGSAQPGNAFTAFGHLSWSPPTVACTGQSNGCLMVFRTYSEASNLMTLRGEINTSGGWTQTAQWTNGGDLAQVASPQISYQSANARFVLAYLKPGSKVIRSYSRALTDTAWSGANTVHTSPTTISPPVLGNDNGYSQRVIIVAVEYAQ